ncbi:MAG: 50S ribosomal protein L6 [Erysipelothrix sp.]|nr:50S ribosomal protein L6 [Erysipelothrix sp.]
MSRIGNKIINIPSGVEVTFTDNNEATVKGPKGTLVQQFIEEMRFDVEDNTITVVRPNETKAMKQIHGTTRSLLANMIEGVTEGFKKELELVGIGYRAAMAGNKLTLNVGFSHPVEFDVEEGLTVEVPKVTQIIITGNDKQRVGELASNIRATRKPEPYKGKGIRYKGEQVRRKEGKTAAKAA